MPRPTFENPSTNFDALREATAKARVLPERLDVKAAFEMAARMLAPTSESDKRRRELIVVSDFQRANWAAADFSLLPADTAIQLESTAPATPSAKPGNPCGPRAVRKVPGPAA